MPAAALQVRPATFDIPRPTSNTAASPRARTRELAFRSRDPRSPAMSALPVLLMLLSLAAAPGGPGTPERPMHPLDLSGIDLFWNTADRIADGQ